MGVKPLGFALGFAVGVGFVSVPLRGNGCETFLHRQIGNNHHSYSFRPLAG